MTNQYYVDTLNSFEANGGYISPKPIVANSMKVTLLPKMRDLAEQNVSPYEAGKRLATEFRWISSLSLCVDLKKP